MTTFFDLPNELLLLIAVELDNTERRRFSKKWLESKESEGCEVYHLGSYEGEFCSPVSFFQSGEYIRVYIHQFEAGACVLEGQGGSFSLMNRCVIITDNTSDLPQAMWNDLNDSGTRLTTFAWTRCRDVADKTMEMIAEWSSYVTVVRVTYTAHFRDFDVAFASRFFRIVKHCEFVIRNDGIYSERAEKLFEVLFAAHVKNTYTLSGTEKSRSVYLTVTEIFSQQYQTPTELARIHLSSLRIMKGVRRLCGWEESVVDNTQEFANVHKRVMWATVGDDEKVYTGMDLNRFSRHVERTTIEDQMRRRIPLNLEQQ